MGGRVAIEVGLTRPERVGGLGLLCPALAFVRRGYQPLVRLLRPELALLPHSFGRRRIEHQSWSMFADRDQVDPSVADIAVDEFDRIYRSAGARLAFLASARSIYLEAPFGRTGLFPRLAELQPPALFVWSRTTGSCPPASAATSSSGCPPPSRSSSTAAGTCRRSSALSARTLLECFLARVDALGDPRPERQAA
ncbi:MAG: alpha/beta hydrolase [Actinomycetota bacterium]|nr:alpha/beta hydrolase [Actinomycetota bacterium]